MTTTFENDTRLVEQAPGRFAGEVSGNWSVAGNPNGGYLMGLLLAAALRHGDKAAAPVVTANFVARAVPGPAVLEVDEIARSGQFQRLEVRLLQEGRERVRGLVTLAEPRPGCPDDRCEANPPPLPPVDACVGLPAMPSYTLFDHVDLRLDPACAGWLQGSLSERSENRGWLRLRDDHPWNLPSLLLAADAMPPAVMASLGPLTWVPTLELSVSLRRLPASRWLNASLRTRFVTCGVLEADGELWDEHGALVALSRQIAQVKRG
jgi:acyl-CoA thioesterase